MVRNAQTLRPFASLTVLLSGLTLGVSWLAAMRAPRAFAHAPAPGRSLRGLGQRQQSPVAVRSLYSGPTTTEVVSAMIADKMGIEADLVTPETTLSEMGVDSLDTLEYVMALEEAFNVQLLHQELSALNNVADVADLIQSKL
mmetsp:Transcript_82379/g.183946  ORF Transcript_82379/g.183946 Transcript_82379/m.183946 type:complete len:142 (-) Transcript_82379:216-641(-)